MIVMDSFERVKNVSPVSAQVMRFTCFTFPEKIPFELLSVGADEIDPELARLIKESTDVRATVISILRPLEKQGLVTIDRENQFYSTTLEIQEVIKENDDT